MTKPVENRPAGAWRGLQINEAPMGSGDGFLLEATDYLIRKGSILEQRPGFTTYSDRIRMTETAPTALWPVRALWTKTAISGIDSVMGVVNHPENQRHYFIDEQPTDDDLQQFRSYQNNYWGYGAWVSDADFGSTLNTVTDNAGMVVGDNRVVDGIYTTQNGPAQLLPEPKTIRDFDTTTGYQNSYTWYSQPLGIPSMPLVTATVGFTNTNTNIWATSSGVTTWSYRAAFRLNEFFGAPSPAAQCRTPQLTRITQIVVTTTGFTVTLPNHGLIVGDYFEILDAPGFPQSQSINRGWNVATVTNANTFTCTWANTSGVTTVNPATGINWRRRVQSQVTIYRPKEQVWTSHNITATHGHNTTVVNDRAGEYFTRPVFQDGEFYLYRTNALTSENGTPAINPGDEHFLVSNVSARFATTNKSGWTFNNADLTCGFLDDRPNSALGSNLYTNLSVEGIGNQNTMPPVSRVHEEYQNHHFWANVKESTVLTFRFTGSQNNRFWIRYQTQPVRGTPLDLVYAFQPSATESIAGLDFNNGATGATPDEQAEIMGRSFCRIVNANPLIPLKARYVSGFGEVPGRVEVTALDYQAVDLTMASSVLVFNNDTNNSGSFIDTNLSVNNGVINLTNVWPAGRNDSATFATLVSEQRAQELEYRIYFSKIQQPYATPRTQFFDVSRDSKIIAMRATSQNLFIVTTDGLYTITGTSESNWSLSKKDNSFRAWSQGAVNLLRDQLFVLTDQGIQVYSDGRTISLGINDLIQPIREQVKTSSVMWDRGDIEPWITSAVDATTNEYLLMIPKSSGTTNHVLRYNMDTGAWSVTDRDLTAGLLYTSNDYNRMLYADRKFSHIVLERRTNDRFLNTDEMLRTPTGLAGPTNEIQRPDGTYTYRGSLVNSVYDDVNGFIRANDHVAVVERKSNGDIYRVKWIRLLGVSEDFNGWLFRTEKPIPTATTGFRYLDWNQTEPTTIELYLAFNIRSRAGLMTFRGGDANMQKRFSEVLIHLVEDGIRELSVETLTDDRKAPITTQINRVNPHDGWGSAPWGRFSWGMSTIKGEPTLRMYTPMEHSVSRTLRVTIDNTGFNQPVRIQGVGVMFTNISQKTVR